MRAQDPLRPGAATLVHLSIHTPRPEHEQDPIASMHRFGAAAEGAPGVEVMRAAVADDPFADWEAEETEGFLLDEV